MIFGLWCHVDRLYAKS